MTDDERLDAIGERLRRLEPDAWDPAPPPPLPAFERPRRRRAWRPALVVAVTAAAAVAAIAVVGADDPIELQPLAGAPAGERGTVSVAGGQVRLEIDGARPTPAGHDEELWYLGEDGDMVSLGTFRVDADGRAEVTFSTDADLADYRFVDVSLEPRDGDPAHSANSLLRSEALT